MINAGAKRNLLSTIPTSAAEKKNPVPPMRTSIAWNRDKPTTPRNRVGGGLREGELE